MAATARLKVGYIPMGAIRKFFRQGELGQGLSEYCLLAALVALVALGVLIHVSGGIGNLWTVANTTLATGGSAASADSHGVGGASVSGR